MTFEVTLDSGSQQSASLTVSGQGFTVYQQAATIPGLSLIGSMPHLAAGGGWLTTFTFINKSSAAASIRPNFFAPDGSPQSLLFDLPQQPDPAGSTLRGRSTKPSRPTQATSSKLLDHWTDRLLKAQQS